MGTAAASLRLPLPFILVILAGILHTQATLSTIMMRQNIKRVTRIRGTTPEIDQRAKELRHHPTPAEALLWACLRNHQLNGLKLRRQHPLGRFIADFCCPACRLIVELDGPIHLRQIQQDQIEHSVLKRLVIMSCASRTRVSSTIWRMC